MRRFTVYGFVGLITFLVVACDPVIPASTGESDIPVGPTAIPTDLPEGVAGAFLDAWMREDYAGMYSLISSNGQLEYTLEQFTNLYAGTASTMTLQSVNAQLLTGLPQTDTTAQFDFQVTYNTLVLGPIEQNLTMNLKKEGDRWGIVWSPALIFPELAASNTLGLQTETPSRANIYDVNGLWLVSANTSIVTIGVVPGQVSTEFEGQMLDLLSRMLRQPPEDILNQYSGLPDDWVIQLGDVDLEVFNQFRNQFFSYPGLTVTAEKVGRRHYNSVAPHVLGYTGFVPAEQCDAFEAQGYSCDELVGLAGLEQWGEPYLAGKRGGVLSAYTASGQYYAEIARIDPEPAQSIYTTIDRDLQLIAQDALESAYASGELTWAPTAGGAAVVILDVNTGAVRAMASYPSFNPNVFNPNNSDPLAQGNYISDILNNPIRPLLNRATQSAQPAGSIFKIVSAYAALDQDIFDLDRTFTSTGIWNPGRGDAYIKYDWLEGGHGTVNISQALTVSCNSCFYEVGLEAYALDTGLLPEYARLFHFGDTFGLPIAENPGNVPDPDGLTSDGRPWSELDSINLAIGQGDLLVTPLHIAVMVASIANDGTIYKPQFVDRIGLIGEEPTVTFAPEVIGTLDLSSEEMAFIQQGMRNVVIGRGSILGTAEYRLGSLRISAAGKTGTAQVSSGAPPLAWFAGYVPFEEPELAIVVMVENGGQGSSVAAPIFRRVVERYYGLPVLDYPPDWSDPERFDFVEDSIGD